jgi:hypothetical protein
VSLLKKLWKFILECLALFARLLRFYLGKDEPRDRHCHCVCPPALKKPDPFIYDQYYLMSLGWPVTWDNRDIYIFDGSILVDPHDLRASTPYTVVARIWNSSTDVPVINLKVNFSYLSFGMGVHSNPIGATTTDLSVRGLPGCPAFAYMTWTTPATLGHYCIQVLLEPPDDSNWLNNLGQRNTQVAQAQSPAVFEFLVGNHVGPRPRAVRFTMDTYTIPPLPLCRERDALAEGSALISKTAPPIPAGWTVTLTPSELQLAPGEERQVQAEITPPAGFTGSMPINVTGWDDSGPIGGVTLIVEVS